ncbi:gamma carbonic anhydrase family protein [Sinomonas sp. ASV322]|uniref:gamma carbonic anhydrase family protein n=1 Tax=Sinomonas sp. ASV322 TaxID=3041920 RepID=UPI0027DD4359|nr:gamma carbonic anhydrase family protein [Sinomonas sp. ASV322]MDQ4501185.1 gamma carbonic anhydrase family protein [Sinomonas sp. ASV322]
MLVTHRGASPNVHAGAYVAPTAVLIGDVTVADGARILHGAVLTAEDGEVTVGENSIVMENALVRGRAKHPARIGDSCMVGPHTHVNGADVGDEVFIATGASLFPGSVVGKGSEVRINAVVQVNTRLEPGAVVPIGWVAVGDPASILPPDQHDRIWEIQRGLDFPGTVYGVDRSTTMGELMRRQSDFYGEHRGDLEI